MSNKRLFPALICAACLLVLSVSCAEKEGGKGVRSVFSVEKPESINSRFDGDAFLLTVTGNVDWGVQYDEGCDWFALMPDYWEAFYDEPETKQVYLVTELNDFPTPRSGRCWIVPAKGRKIEITVTQEANPGEN